MKLPKLNWINSHSCAGITHFNVVDSYTSNFADLFETDNPRSQ